MEIRSDEIIVGWLRTYSKAKESLLENIVYVMLSEILKKVKGAFVSSHYEPWRNHIFIVSKELGITNGRDGGV